MPSDPTTELLAKQQYLLALREKARLVSEDPLRYFYKPHNGRGRGGQDAFHRAAATHRIRGTFTGNRWGKSFCGTAEDLAWLRGERPWYPASDHARRAGIPAHPVKGLIIVTDWDICDEVFTTQAGDRPGKIWQLETAANIKSTKRNSSGAIASIEHRSGSVLHFDTVKSFLSNEQGAESKDWDFIHVDEPCPEALFKAHARGLIDRGGSAWFNLTALREPWIIDYVEQHGWAYYGDIWENPSLNATSIEAYAALLSDEEKECRLFGKPLHLAGLVYKQFDERRHIIEGTPSGWENELTPPRSWTIYVRIDPHPQTPHAVLFCAVSPTGQRIYYREIFRKCTIPELCIEIREYLRGYTVGSIKIDPSAWVPDPVTKRNAAAAFRDGGLNPVKARKDLEGGILSVSAALSLKDPTMLFFTKSVRRTLWEIRRYCWDPERLNRPIDRDDHMMENLYRMEIDKPRHLDAESGITVGEYEITSTRLSEPDLSYLNQESSSFERDALAATLD